MSKKDPYKRLDVLIQKINAQSMHLIDRILSQYKKGIIIISTT
ncbi:MAG TPA: hypothetical protein VHJ38_00870 [Nitrososphaeraceae archaeon]|nr:hypothetical protein [Nitrososphaeraceae archaeon]